ncbi:MAG: J domain-containing protein [Firmicutes bacterium]|nr:J domain-containing protein [Bacillota bacterium]
MKMKYFNNPETLEDLKKQYRELAFKHHPDRGGTNEDMKAVNNEYDELFQTLKDIHRTKDGESYTAKNPTNETSEQFRNIIDEVMKMDNIVIEIIGCFIWVTGNTKVYKAKLKELKFNWHNKKIAWYLKPEDYNRRSHKDYELDEIREMYGTSGTVKSKGTEKIESFSKA